MAVHPVRLRRCTQAGTQWPSVSTTHPATRSTTVPPSLRSSPVKRTEGADPMPMQPWFREAKLGIFVHYGIYAVDGVEESWSFYRGDVSHERYMAQLERFTAAAYDPEAWADLFSRAGADYAVLTTRHHDGVALWDTAYGGLNTVQHTPARRDLVSGYAKALRSRGLKVGFYYSLSNWNHPDYASVAHPDPDPAIAVEDTLTNPYVVPADGEQNPDAWQRYRHYLHGQVTELAREFRPDLFWFDGEWERSEEQWGVDEIADRILAENAHTVFNGRLLGRGDYATPEQGIPVSAPDGPWELALTVNDSWGFRHSDQHFKSVTKLVRYFGEVIGMGGNLLLNVGPREDGSLPAEAITRLEGLGSWITKHDVAVHGTDAGLPPGHHYGPSTVSADRLTLYLFCLDVPREVISLRGLMNRIERVTVVGSGTELGHRTDPGLGAVPGQTWIDAPADADIDEHVTVLAVELDSPLALYSGRGRN
ncbi:alpha-L-fucosidase [Streptomyces sp. NPDC093586]|uniref:alpha-L-fucosidase n=1 Tax=Streptomyces sp. NPDC093586 TaxID=3366042 RepID=UPI00382DFC43